MFKKITYENRRFSKKTIHFDSARFIGCKFENCKINYSGYGITLIDCEFDHVGFTFHGKAANALNVLKMIDESGGEQYIERTFPNSMAR